MAHDDPEGWDYYNKTVDAAAGDPDIFILSNLNNVGSVEVNAFQVHSDALVQKSIREGFGLTVTEALDDAFDFIIVHDPQPAGVIDHARACGRHWIWRCHIDLSTPNEEVLEFLLPWLHSYDSMVFHLSLIHI